MKRTKFLALALALAAGFAGMGCGKGKFVEMTKIRTYNNDQGAAFVEWISIFNTGEIHLPAFQIPVADPRDPTADYGTIALRDVLRGGSELALTLNLSRVISLPGGTAFLPNGAHIPVGGLDGVAVITIPIPTTGVRIYFAFGERVAMLGAAFVIREFDVIGGVVGGVNLFPSFQFGPVRGIAGIFTGRGPGQSGIAAFVDAGAAFAPPSAPPGQEGIAMASSPLVVAGIMSPLQIRNRGVSQLRFTDVAPSERRQRQVARELDRLSGRRLHLGR